MSNTHSIPFAASFDAHPLDMLRILSGQAALMARLFCVDPNGEPVTELDGKFAGAMFYTLSGFADILEEIHARLAGGGK